MSRESVRGAHESGILVTVGRMLVKQNILDTALRSTGKHMSVRGARGI